MTLTKTVLVTAALALAAFPADAQTASLVLNTQAGQTLSPPGRPPAHFPGSQGRLAHVHAQRVADYERRLTAYRQAVDLPSRQPQQSYVQVSNQSPLTRKADEPAPPPTPEQLGKDIADLDGKVRAGLENLGKSLAELDKDRRSWASLDKTVAAAKTVNEALLARCDEMVGIYDRQIVGALADFRKKLGGAPAVYRAMAAERRAQAGTAVIAVERDAFLTMADMCEAAAELCEQRYREVFTSPKPSARSTADALADSIASVRRMQKVHLAWRDTLAAWPSVLNDPRLGGMMDQLNRYAEDLVSYQKGVSALTDAMKQKAAEESPKPEGGR